MKKQQRTTVPSTLSDNTNLFQPTAFQVEIDRNRLGNFAFFAQRVIHPGMTNSAAEVPFRNFQSAPMPGGQLQFGELSIDVLLDEDWKSYTEIHDWLWRLANVKMIEKRDNFASKTSETPSHHDIIVTILTNQNNHNKRIQYHDCIPTSIGDVSFEATNAAVDYVTFPANFRFTYYEIK